MSSKGVSDDHPGARPVVEFMIMVLNAACININDLKRVNSLVLVLGDD